MPRKKPPKELQKPHIRLYGEVAPDMLDRFFEQLGDAPEEGPLVVEMTTVGGDAEIGRRLAVELRLLRDAGREVHFLGKAVVYSAGVTMMAAVPRQNRWLTPCTLLLIHGRKLTKTIELDGNLRAAEQSAKALLAEAQTGIAAEDEGFAELAVGSKLSEKEIRERALCNWYLTAEEALECDLVEALYGPTPPPSKRGSSGSARGGGVKRRG